MWTEWNGKKINALLESELSDANLLAIRALGEITDTKVPHDEGYLQKSKVVMKDPSNKMISVLAYGGGGASGFPLVPYAVKWHEVPANFQKGRTHNYVRTPLNSKGAELLRRSIQRKQAEAL